MHAGAQARTRCGVRLAAVTTPAALISEIRCPIRSGLTGSR